MVKYNSITTIIHIKKSEHAINAPRTSKNVHYLAIHWCTIFICIMSTVIYFSNRTPLDAFIFAVIFFLSLS